MAFDAFARGRLSFLRPRYVRKAITLYQFGAKSTTSAMPGVSEA